MVTLDKLRYFCEAAELEHVGRAAKSLHISASAISDAIKVLEEELDCKLFDRINKKIVLNENGKALLEKARNILYETENLASIVKDRPLSLEGNFTVAASPYLMKNFLLDACLEVKKKHPGLNFHFASEETSRSISKVIRSEVDFALIFKSLDYNGISGEVLYQGDFIIALGSKHPLLRAKRELRVEALNKLPAITFKPDTSFNYIENHPALKKLGLTANHTFYYDNNDTSIHLLKKTDGWAFLPDIIVKSNSSIKQLKLESWSAPYSIELVRRAESKGSPLYRAVLEELRKLL